MVLQRSTSALMLAVDCDSAECVTSLLDHDATVNAVDSDGYTALCNGIRFGKK